MSSPLSWLCRFVPAICICAAAATPAVPPNVPFHERRILVKPLASTPLKSLTDFHAVQGARLLWQFKHLGNIQALQLPKGASVQQFLERYRHSRLVEYAEPDYRVYPALTPNEPSYLDGTLWYLHNFGQNGGMPGADIHAPGGWDTQSGASNLVVAIVDTGVRYTHEDLASNMWVNPGEIPGNGIDDDSDGTIDDIYGLNASNNSGDPLDLNGHGTEVAGVVGAVGDNGLGGVGVAWRVKIMACRYTSDDGRGYTFDIVKCIDYARRKGAHVINASFVSSGYSFSMYDAINRCRDAGIIVVAASGNNAGNNDLSPCYPASYPLDNIVPVAATTRTDDLAGFSNFGHINVALAAPGTDIFTTANGSDSAYTFASGTSFSAPMVAGAIALLKARYPSESCRELLNRLYAGVDLPPGLAGKCATGGRLNLSKALAPSLTADFTALPCTGAVPLTATFTDTSSGMITNWSWDFGDGTDSSQRNPSHTFSWAGNFIVVLTVTDALGQTNRKNQTLSAVANYQISNGSYEWIDPSSMNLLLTNCGVVSPAQPLPFTFMFYGSAYNQLFIGAHGLVGFEGEGFCSLKTNLPNSTLPNNIICPFWDGFDLCAGGAVYMGTIGSAPNRKVVVSWVSVPRRFHPEAPFTFQAWLEEGSQRIQFQYQNVESGSEIDSPSGATASIGLEHSSGLVAAEFSHLGSTLVTNNQAILFLPTWPGRLEVCPKGLPCSAGHAGGPFLPTDCIFVLTNSGAANLDWALTTDANWLTFSSTNGTLAPHLSATVRASLNANSNSLQPGTNATAISFANLADPSQTTTQTLALEIYSPLTVGYNLFSPPKTFQMSVQGVPGWTYLLETSTNLINWELSSTALAPNNGLLRFQDGLETNCVQRFYRVVQP